MTKKDRNVIIIVICLVLLIGYLITRKPSTKTTGNGPEEWDGIPVSCCWCNGEEEICGTFDLNTCPIDTVSAHDWASLECNK